LFDRNRAFLVSTPRDLEAAFLHSTTESLWIITRPQWTERLVSALARSLLDRGQPAGPLGDLLMLAPSPRSELIPPLRSHFRRIIGDLPPFRILPLEQLAEVLTSPRRSDLFIGGCLDRATESLTLVRGDLNLLTVPLRIFRTRGATKPDFKQFDVDEYGYAIRFGAYEASADKVLYEADPDYRRRFNAQRPATEQGFGPSLKRLRILRQLSRDEFPGVPARSIASLERESAVKPRARTLNALAKTLQVDPEEIETY